MIQGHPVKDGLKTFEEKRPVDWIRESFEQFDVKSLLAVEREGVQLPEACFI